MSENKHQRRDDQRPSAKLIWESDKPEPVCTWRQRLGLAADFPLYLPSNVEWAMEAEITELRTQLDAAHQVGKRLFEALAVGQGARDAVRTVLDEVERATRKFPTWPTDPLHAVAVLGEEFGELTKAVLQTSYEPHKVKEGELRTEAIQTAAMALRFVASLDRYEFTQCAQHEQPAMAAPQAQASAKEGGDS